MKYLQAVIEKSSAVYKYFTTDCDFSKIFHISWDDFRCCSLDVEPEKLKISFFSFFRNLEFIFRNCKIDRNLGSFPSYVWVLQDPPWRRYKRLKNEISTAYNTNMFNTLEQIVLPRFDLKKLFDISLYYFPSPKVDLHPSVGVQY